LPPLADLHVDHQALADLADAAVDTAKKSDLITPLSDGLEVVLKRLQDGLQTLHVPYSYGFSIILLTMIVKIVTFPLTKKQVGCEQLVEHA
jgi:YidC/Oxa1 family membrane protein insertase